MPPKAGKPSNADLLAERKAIAAMLVEFPGDTNIEKLNAYMDQQKSVVEMLVEKNKLLSEKETVAAPAGQNPDVIVGKPSGPMDYAHYPKPGEVVPVPVQTDGPPAMTAKDGDLTPAYAQWFLETNGPAATKAKYGDRITYLPENVRRALA